VVNSILWGNLPEDVYSRGYHESTGVTAGHTIEYCNTESVYDGVGNIQSDPGFVNTDPGSGPIDLHLTSTSGAVDRGKEGDSIPLKDKDGAGRIDVSAVANCDPADAGADAADCTWFTDMGAYEYDPG
jgi:hypothetical protein